MAPINLETKKWLMGNGHSLSWSPIKESYIEDLPTKESRLLKDGLFGIAETLSRGPDFFEDKDIIVSYEVYRRLPSSIRERSSFYFYQSRHKLWPKERDLIIVDFHTKIDGELGHLPILPPDDFKPAPLLHLSVCGGPTPYLAPIFNRINKTFNKPQLMSQSDIEAVPSAQNFNCKVIKNPILQSKSSYETRILELNGTLHDSLPKEAMEIDRKSLSPWVDFVMAKGCEPLDIGLNRSSFLKAFRRRVERGDLISALNLLHAQMGKY